MGTRNLTCVFHDGKYKLAQYCQWDGYPKGQGLKVLNFLRKVDLAAFIAKLSRCRFADEKELQKLWDSCGAQGKDSVSTEVFEKVKTKHFQIHRDCGADVLTVIMNGEGDLPLNNSINFAYDSLFCEWCYVIDLDKGVFEVHKGFNKKKLGPRARFSDVAHLSDNEYFPVRLKTKFKLAELPMDEVFLKKCGED